MVDRTRCPVSAAESVGADLALVDDRALVAVQELDRVLDRDDVLGVEAIDLVDHRGERRGLARARGARHENDAALLVGDVRDHVGQPEFLDRADLVRDRPGHERDHAALAEGVDAEARKAGEAEREVDLVLVGELLELAPLDEERAQGTLGVGWGQPVGARDLFEMTEAPDEGLGGNLEVKVRALDLYDAPHRRLEVEHMTLYRRLNAAL